MNRNEQQQPAPKDGEAPRTEGAERRPYRTPELRTYPLFERMALACTSDLKGSGEEDDS